MYYFEPVERTATEMWDLLNMHDWYYAFKDCSKAYHEGNERDRWLQFQAKFNGHWEMYEEFHAHKFSGYPWTDEKLPKPERPTE